MENRNQKRIKVCGVTAIDTPNYGTVLQAFALKEAVESLGYQYTLLNYCNKEQKLKFTFWGKTEYMSWKYYIYKKIQYPFQRLRMKRILDFQNKNNNLSPKIKSKRQLDKICDKFDVFITGSDQVWNNQEINHFDDVYYLRFAKDKNTISYAASFGKTLDMLVDKDIEFYKANLHYVKHLSVREESGKEIIEEITGREAKWVCDPVYLLPAERYLEYAVTPKKKHYLLVYLIGNSINEEVNQVIIKEADRLGKKLHIPVLKVSRGLSSIVREKSFYIPTTNEWLGLVKNADLILTNSFHGTAFSIIFEKKFFCFVNGQANERMNTRFYGILDYLGLNDRVINIREKHNYYTKKEVDFRMVKTRLDQLRNSSMEFISNSISGGANRLVFICSEKEKYYMRKRNLEKRCA